MTTYHHDFCGANGIIEDLPDGRAKLKVNVYTFSGLIEIHNKIHKNRKAALAAWYRLTN